MIKTRVSKNINCHDCSVNHLCIATDVSSSSIDSLNDLIKNVRRVPKKEHLYHADTPMQNLYAIHQGSCKEYWIDEDGNECVTNFYFPGDIMGIESVSQEKHMYYAMALEDVELCLIPIAGFMEVMQEKPDILKRFVTITNQKMKNDQSTRMGITANERVCDFLLNIAMRMCERNPNINEICLTMSQVDISNFLGIAGETVNRIFNNLKKNEIINIQNKTFEILDLSQLKKLGKLDYSLMEEF
jgi:CRP/FNR family transcriptional regulator